MDHLVGPPGGLEAESGRTERPGQNSVWAAHLCRTVRLIKEPPPAQLASVDGDPGIRPVASAILRLSARDPAAPNGMGKVMFGKQHRPLVPVRRVDVGTVLGVNAVSFDPIG